jgi:hypothetical protein
MRNLILAGVAGAALALGAAGAHAASIQNRPESSPYALIQPLTVAPAPLEGRSAFVDEFGAAPVVDAPVRGGPIKNNGQVPHLDAR